MSGLPGETNYGLPEPGDLIAGKYRVERLLGKGGMGAVFAAQHELLQQRVAVKLLLTELAGGAESVSRFLNEARAAARIQNENVARVMDVGTQENGLPYIVMEYLEGSDLSQVLEQRGSVSVTDAVDYVLQALEAIAQAHVLGIVHRDLKPANLFLARRQDQSVMVKVLDFGISKATNPLSGGSGAMTSTKALLGSPYYMSPEQLRSSKNVDARADIWSIGVILYELVTGSLPFVGENLGELFAAILEQEAPPIRAKRPDVSPEFDQVVLHCLQRKAEHRFANVAELATALAPFSPVRGAYSLQRIRGTMPSQPTSGTSPHASTVGAFSQSASGRMGSGVFNDAASPGASTGQTAPGPMVSSNPALNTNASWGNTGAPKAPSNHAKIALVVVPAMLLGVALVGAAAYQAYSWKLQREATAAAASASAVQLEAARIAPPEPVAPAPPPVPMNTAAAADSGSKPLAQTASPSTPAIKTPSTSRHGTVSPPASAAAPVASPPATPPKPVPFDPTKDSRR
jgi:serine/threonine protein kinase